MRHRSMPTACLWLLLCFLLAVLTPTRTSALIGVAAISAASKPRVVQKSRAAVVSHNFAKNKKNQVTRVSASTSASSSSSATTARASFYKLPQPLRFCLSGTLGNVALYFCEKWAAIAIAALIAVANKGIDAAAPGSYSFLTQYQESISFFLGYLLHIVPQHLLHASLVYGLETINTWRKYFLTLAGMYSALSIALVGSTVLNSTLRKVMEKHVAFMSTLVMFAGVNYFVIGWIVAKAAGTAEKSSSSPPPPSSRKWGTKK